MRYFVALLVLVLQVKALEVHEWGTFTTMHSPDGRQLIGMEKSEEALPPFVRSIVGKRVNFSLKGFGPGTIPKNVTVRMETPVIYFYSDKEQDFEVKVGFKDGIISEWYPMESLADSFSKRMEKFHIKGNSPKQGPHRVWDLAKPTYDEIVWKGKVLAPDSELSYTSPQSQETVTWVNPRHTDSNLVKINHQVEKFIFYRGVANFEQGLKFNSQEKNLLKISNKYTDTVPYILVYEYKNGQKIIHWQGALSADEKREIILKDYDKKLRVTNPRFQYDFTQALCDAGLFKKEARAMLETWRHSYFEKTGLRVFYILPRKDVDEILPMTLKPVPKKLERVIVGRAEIMRSK